MPGVGFLGTLLKIAVVAVVLGVLAVATGLVTLPPF
jgi:hypothetical protein